MDLGSDLTVTPWSRRCRLPGRIATPNRSRARDGSRWKRAAAGGIPARKCNDHPARRSRCLPVGSTAGTVGLHVGGAAKLPALLPRCLGPVVYPPSEVDQMHALGRRLARFNADQWQRDLAGRDLTDQLFGRQVGELVPAHEADRDHRAAAVLRQEQERRTHGLGPRGRVDVGGGFAGTRHLQTSSRAVGIVATGRAARRSTPGACGCGHASAATSARLCW